MTTDTRPMDCPTDQHGPHCRTWGAEQYDQVHPGWDDLHSWEITVQVIENCTFRLEARSAEEAERMFFDGDGAFTQSGSNVIEEHLLSVLPWTS